MTVAGKPLCAEEVPVGVPIDLGTYAPSAEEIVAFATAWDPLSFHVDPESARGSGFGGLIASGVHTLAIFQRLAVRSAYGHWAVIAGRALRDVRFPAPVRPGMALAGCLVVEEVQLVRPDRALITQRGCLVYGDRTVLTLRCDAYVRRLPPTWEPSPAGC